LFTQTPAVGMALVEYLCILLLNAAKNGSCCRSLNVYTFKSNLGFLVFLSLIGFPLIGVILYSYPIGFVLSSKKFYFVLKPTFALSFGGAAGGCE
jgi:hypothetical protein